MKKCIILFIALGFLTAIGTGQSFLLKNDNFQSWTTYETSQHLDFWTMSKSGQGFQLALDDTVQYDDIPAMKFSLEIGEAREIQQTDIVISNGTVLDLKAHILENDPGVRMKMLVRWNDKDGKKIGESVSSDFTSDNADWQTLSLVTPPAPLNAASVVIKLRMVPFKRNWKGSGSAHLAEVKLFGIPAESK